MKKELSKMEKGYIDSLIDIDLEINDLYKKLILLDMYNIDDDNKRNDIIIDIKNLHNVEKSIYNMLDISLNNILMYLRYASKVLDSFALISDKFKFKSRIKKQLVKLGLVNSIRLENNKSEVKKERYKMDIISIFREIDISKVFIRELMLQKGKISNDCYLFNIMAMYQEIFINFYLEEELIENNFDYKLLNYLSVERVAEALNVTPILYETDSYTKTLISLAEELGAIDSTNENAVILHAVALLICSNIYSKEEIKTTILHNELLYNSKNKKYLDVIYKKYIEDVGNYRRVFSKPHKF